jgi:hypothetical protein
MLHTECVMSRDRRRNLGFWPVLPAVFGALAIGCGSLIGIAAPGDGQTGMTIFPMWGLGAMLGLFAVAMCISSRASAAVWSVVVVCALIAIGSVVKCVDVTMKYEPKSRAQQRGS